MTWGLGDPVASDGWGSAKIALLHRLLPQIRQFVCVRQALVRAGELAAATGRTPGAITWHLKQIYRRQPISGQVDLVRLVLSLTEFE